MASEHILVDIRSGVCTLTVNRPDKLNALNRQTLLDLDAAFLRAERDDSIRVLVLTGAGDRAFVAGADIGGIRELSAVGGRAFSAPGPRGMSRIQNLGKPVVGGTDGAARGGGLEGAGGWVVRCRA